MNVTSFQRTIDFMRQINFARNFTSPMPYEDVYTSSAYPFVIIYLYTFYFFTSITSMTFCSLVALGIVGVDTGAVNYNRSSLR